MPESTVNAFQSWCEDLAAKKARNALPGEPAAPLVNAVLVPAKELVDSFVRLHPDQASEKEALDAFTGESGAWAGSG